MMQDPSASEKSRAALMKGRPRYLPTRTASRILVLLTVILLLVTLASPTEAAILGMSRREAPNSRKVNFVNQSGRRVDVLWINRSTNPISYVSNSENGEGYPYGATQGINSFIGHEFEIREMPSKRTGECKVPGDCQTGYFQVNDQEGQKVTIDKDFNVKHEDDRTIARAQADGLLDECDKELNDPSMDPLQLVDAITDCMEQKVKETLAKQEEERNFQAKIRREIASELVPYACGDVNFTTTDEVINRTWTFDDKTYQMQVFHEQVASSILRIPDFATPEECNALQFFVESDNHVPFSAVNDMTKQGRLVHGLASRFYEVARAVLGWKNLEFQSQYDDFSVNLLDIYKDTDGVSILPRCSEEDMEEWKSNSSPGDGPAHCLLPGAMRPKASTREFTVSNPSHVASVFLFCNQQENQVSGGVHFPDAGVHINREPNLLVLATHQSIVQAGFDGYTEKYHFCPNYDVMTHTLNFKDYLAGMNGGSSQAASDSSQGKDEL